MQQGQKLQQVNNRRESFDLRRECGLWLQGLRQSAGYTQRALAQRVGEPHYTFISQLECGYGRLPPESYAIWAAALGVPASEFVKTLLRFYEPTTFALLFPDDVFVTKGLCLQTSEKLRQPRRGRPPKPRPAGLSLAAKDV